MRPLLTSAATAAAGLVLLASVGLAQQQASSTQAVCTSGTGTAQIALLNPKAGDSLPNGAAMVLDGVAFDPGASQGTGIDSVRVFLDDRESGGEFLGAATLGQANPGVTPGSQFSTAGFTLRTNALPTGSDPHVIVVYAHSTVTNMERVLRVPIYVGSLPSGWQAWTTALSPRLSDS
jgi:hypothetical protein